MHMNCLGCLSVFVPHCRETSITWRPQLLGGGYSTSWTHGPFLDRCPVNEMHGPSATKKTIVFGAIETCFLSLRVFSFTQSLTGHMPRGGRLMLISKMDLLDTMSLCHEKVEITNPIKKCGLMQRHNPQAKSFFFCIFALCIGTEILVVWKGSVYSRHIDELYKRIATWRAQLSTSLFRIL